MKNKRILVTGGAGYNGSVLVRKLLNEGYYVRAMDNLLHGGNALISVFSDKRFEFVLGDVTKQEDCAAAIKDVDGVVHLAAIVGDPACAKNQGLAKKTNLDATLALIDLAKKNKVERFILASTCSNYGISDSSSLAVEDSPLNPVSLYAETKVESEKFILGRTGNGFKPTVLRLSTVYGISPRMRFDLTVNDFVKEAFSRRRLVIFGEKFWRPYIHVEDVANAILLVLEDEEGKTTGQVYNAGDTGENYQKETLGNLIKERIKDVRIEYVKKIEDPRSYKVSFEKIKSELGFQVTKKVPDGIEEITSLLEKKLISDYDEIKYRNC